MCVGCGEVCHLCDTELACERVSYLAAWVLSIPNPGYLHHGASLRGLYIKGKEGKMKEKGKGRKKEGKRNNVCGHRCKRISVKGYAEHLPEPPALST